MSAHAIVNRKTGYRPNRLIDAPSDGEGDISIVGNLPTAFISAIPQPRIRSESAAAITAAETEEERAARLGPYVTISVEMVSDPRLPNFEANAVSRAHFEAPVRYKVRQVSLRNSVFL